LGKEGGLSFPRVSQKEICWDGRKERRNTSWKKLQSSLKTKATSKEGQFNASKELDSSHKRINQKGENLQGKREERLPQEEKALRPSVENALQGRKKKGACVRPAKKKGEERELMKKKMGNSLVLKWRGKAPIEGRGELKKRKGERGKRKKKEGGSSCLRETCQGEGRTDHSPIGKMEA